MAVMNVRAILERAEDEKASDIFITSGVPVMFKKNGVIEPIDNNNVTPDSAEKMIKEIFSIADNRHWDEFTRHKDVDFSISLAGVGRFRVSAFYQCYSMAAVLRLMQPNLPDHISLGIPDAVVELYKKPRGLVLVTGSTGAGKSTTLASIMNFINEHRNGHMLTFEDPIEYMHPHKRCIVNQREIGTDTESYSKALRAGLRQAPDVMLVGEMRDFETISIALTAAETGTLVLSTLHTIGAAKSIDRIIDVFPPNQQQQTRVQLSTVLQAVVTQQLLPSPTKGRIAVFEIMMANDAIRNLIRESKIHQIDTAILSGREQGMQLMDYSIYKAYKKGDITYETAFAHCVNPDVLGKYITG